MIELKSRDSNIRSTAQEIDENIYLLITNSRYLRVGGSQENPEFIDLDGGPMLRIGDEFDGKRIKGFDINNKDGYLIICE